MNSIEKSTEIPKTKVILISGSRYWNSKEDYNKIKEELEKYSDSHNETVIVVGDCRGVDALALRAAKELNYAYRVFKADWNKYGNAAGPIRNKEMVDFVKGYDLSTGKVYSPKGESLNEKLVLAFHDDIEKSKGTKNLIKLAKSESFNIKLIN